jgi:hypothetical protein
MQKQTNRRTANKAGHKITNWSEYNRCLINRGKISLWITDGLLEHWFYEGCKQKGGQYVYSDACIEFCLTIKVVLKLGYRQTQGFIESIFETMEVDLPVPSYSDMCKRTSKVEITLEKYKKPANETGIYICVDSTGLKVAGEGEWKVRRHGWSKHRTWQKLHLAINPKDSNILNCQLTTNSIADGAVVSQLLAPIQAKITKFAADGAYDIWKVYEELEQKNIKALIPPQKNCKIYKHGNSKGRPVSRDQNIRMIRKLGRRKWKKKTGYHMRSLAETGMFRYKTIIGEKLKCRNFRSQETEITIGCKILNTMIKLGRPSYG